MLELWSMYSWTVATGVPCQVPHQRWPLHAPLDTVFWPDVQMGSETGLNLNKSSSRWLQDRHTYHSACVNPGLVFSRDLLSVKRSLLSLFSLCFCSSSSEWSQCNQVGPHWELAGVLLWWHDTKGELTWVSNQHLAFLEDMLTSWDHASEAQHAPVNHLTISSLLAWLEWLFSTSLSKKFHK